MRRAAASASASSSVQGGACLWRARPAAAAPPPCALRRALARRLALAPAARSHAEERTHDKAASAQLQLEVLKRERMAAQQLRAELDARWGGAGVVGRRAKVCVCVCVCQGGGGPRGKGGKDGVWDAEMLMEGTQGCDCARRQCLLGQVALPWQAGRGGMVQESSQRTPALPRPPLTCPAGPPPWRISSSSWRGWRPCDRPRLRRRRPGGCTGDGGGCRAAMPTAGAHTLLHSRCMPATAALPA